MLDPFLRDCVEYRFIRTVAMMSQIIAVSGLQAMDISGNFKEILFFVVDTDRENWTVFADQMLGALQGMELGTFNIHFDETDRFRDAVI